MAAQGGRGEAAGAGREWAQDGRTFCAFGRAAFASAGRFAAGTAALANPSGRARFPAPPCSKASLRANAFER